MVNKNNKTEKCWFWVTINLRRYVDILWFCVGLFTLLFLYNVMFTTPDESVVTNNVAKNLEYLVLESSKDVYKTENLKTMNISCNSDSMGLTLRCDQYVEVEPVLSNEELVVGNIYVYRTSSSNVGHRFVGCVDVDCNTTIFKGDNNYYAELVPRGQVRYMVKKVVYR